MARTTRFPNLNEFRARASRLGHRTGASELDLPHEPPSVGVAVPWLWIGVATLAVSALGWLGLQSSDRSATTSIAVQMRDPSPTVTGSIDRSDNRGPVGLRTSPDVERRLAELERALRQRGSSGGGLGAIEDRLSVLEDAVGPTVSSLPLQPVEDTTRQRPAPTVLDPAVSPLPPSLQPRGTAARGRLLLPQHTQPTVGSGQAPEYTASLPAQAGTGRNTPPSATGSRAQPAQTGGLQFGLDLGGFRTVDALEDSWARLAVVFPNILGDLEPRKVTRVESNGTHSYRLIAGPYGAVSDTIRACDLLRQRGVACTQAVHVGERFSR